MLACCSMLKTDTNEQHDNVMFLLIYYTVSSSIFNFYFDTFMSIKQFDNTQTRYMYNTQTVLSIAHEYNYVTYAYTQTGIQKMAPTR